MGRIYIMSELLSPSGLTVVYEDEYTIFKKALTKEEVDGMYEKIKASRGIKRFTKWKTPVDLENIMGECDQ